jgi:hypothetical protein
MDNESVCEKKHMEARDFSRVRLHSWNTKSNGTGTKYMPGDTLTSYSNVTLYAQWKRITYKITEHRTI